MIKQLSLFDTPDWLSINNDWLLNYLNQYFPELKFRYEDDYIAQSRYKGVELYFAVRKTDKLDIWANPILIHLDVSKRKGNYEGQGLAVNNMSDFEEQLERFVVKFYEYVKEAK